MDIWPFGKKKDEPAKAEEPVLTEADGPQCSLCGKMGADKRFASQPFHTKCLRKARNQAKTMI